jgi:hypothetical protein
MAAEPKGRRPAVERRGPDRLVIPECPNCHTNDYVTVTNRPGLVVHLRCDHCLYIWSVPKHPPDPLPKVGRR